MIDVQSYYAIDLSVARFCDVQVDESERDGAGVTVERIGAGVMVDTSERIGAGVIVDTSERDYAELPVTNV